MVADIKIFRPYLILFGNIKFRAKNPKSDSSAFYIFLKCSLGFYISLLFSWFSLSALFFLNYFFIKKFYIVFKFKFILIISLIFYKNAI